MDSLSQGVLNRITLALNTERGLAEMSGWLQKYTRLDGRAFSFRDHEMQIAICNDVNARVVVQKCSQVGLSELSARKAAGTAAITKGKHILYVLPTRTFASKFSASRMSPVIESSPMLSGMASSSVKSSELRKLGDSFIHMGGTSGSVNGAISVPASFVFQDEVDFADQAVLGMYESRLKHAKEDEHGRKGHVIKFSTPTVPEYGINADFILSDQKHYNVKCKCGHDFAPDYFKDIVIPGYDGDILDLSPNDIKSGAVSVKDAYIACPSCKKDVWEELCNPKRRHWVPKFPERITSGYQIHPWDVPKVNSVPSILMQMPEYKNIADYYNFTVGIPWVDKDNSFVMDIDNDAHSPWLTNGQGHGAFYMGVDVGKTSNITIGRIMPDGSEEINYLEQYTASGSNAPLYERIIELAGLYNVACTVIDAAPDFTTALEVIKALPNGRVYACEYVRSMRGTLDVLNLPNDPEKPEDYIVKAVRTGTLQQYMRAHNSKMIKYPNPKAPESRSEMITLKEQIKNTKKIRVTNADGDIEEKFVATGPDHYAHSTNYMRMAMAIGNTRSLGSYSFKPAVSKFKFSKKKAVTKISDVL